MLLKNILQGGKKRLDIPFLYISANIFYNNDPQPRLPLEKTDKKFFITFFPQNLSFVHFWTLKKWC
jgi:hypothetical protein